MLLAIGTTPLAHSIVPMTAVASWFDKKIGKATALLTAGVGIGGILVPVVVWLIGGYGWRTSLVVIGIGIWVICLPLSLMVRHKPEPYGYLPDGKAAALSQNQEVDTTEPAGVEHNVKEALKVHAFWLLTLGTFVGFLCLAAIMVHLIPYLESINFTRERAGFVMSAMILISTAGRLGFGWLADVWDKRKLLAITFAMQALGVFMLAYGRNGWFIILFLFTFSLSYSGQLLLRPAIQREYFGRGSFGGIQGMMTVGATLAMFAAPPFVGWVFDVRGSYYLAWIALALVTVVGVPLSLMLKAPQRKARSAQGQP